MSEEDDRLKYAQDFAHAALRGLIVVNGGAVVAMFTFIGNSDRPFDYDAVWLALFCFCAGLSSVIAASICGYLSHSSSREGKERSAGYWERLGITLTVASLIFFILGGGQTIAGVLPQP